VESAAAEVEAKVVAFVGLRGTATLEFVAVTTRWMDARENAGWMEAHVRGANALLYPGVKAKMKGKHFGKIAEMQRLVSS